MLPSQGLFRSIPCPFFLAGLCERPHCSFRHCRSDIRIDRKLETESLDETTPSAEDTVETNKATHTPTNATAQLVSTKEPVVNPLESTSCSASSSSKSENTKEISSPPERLISKNAEVQNSSAVVEPTRKRSRDSDCKDASKRRKLSSDTHNDMGGLVSKVKGIVTSAASSCSSKSDTSSSNSSSTSGGGKRNKDKDKTDDIDRLVEEIEKTGKSPSSSDSHSKSKKSHKHHRHKHTRHKDNNEESKESSNSSNNNNHHSASSSSHRKENRSSKDDHHHHHSKRTSEDNNKKDKDRERRDSSKKEHHHSHSKHSDYHKRRKDSNDSVSSSNSSHKRIRKSSSCNNDTEDKRLDKRNSASEHTSRKKEHSSSSTPKKDDGRSSKSSTEKSGSSDIIKETLKSVQQNNSIDTTNRFNVLAESSADESAYNSDVFDESLDFKYPGGSDSEDDPELVARECLELFENYKPEVPETPKDGKLGDVASGNSKEEDLDEGFCVVGKKRVAHANAIMKAPSTPVSIPKQPPATSKNLQDTLFRRFEDQSKNRINVQNGCLASSSSTPTSPKPGVKMRIAHVPNAGKLAQKPVINLSSKSTSGQGSVPGQPGSLTYSQTVAKGVKREAHKPSPAVITKQGPIIFKDAINKSTKIPHLTRQQIMDKMFAEYCRLLEDHEQAFQMTVARENELIGKCSSKQVYYSSGISIISGLRKASKTDSDYNSGPNRVVSHQHILSGGSLEARNCSVRTVKKEGIPTGNALYKALRKYVMTEQQLIDNGYPRPHPSGEHGRALAKPRPGEENSMTLTNRICDRCKKRYMTTEDGEHIVSEVCNYHWGRKFTTASRAGRGTRESSYVCCGSDDDKIGCVTSICHVSKCPVPISSQKGFVEAVLEEGPEEKMGEDPWDIIGIDCEMVYTTHGNELARVTIVGVDRKVLYDEIVKPTHKVLDCNSRFSGITFDDMDKAKRTITDIQAIILTHLRPNTIIIGHSLESDLIALRLKHECVIDTSILYPHRMGPPKKRALRNLSVDILKKVIQESDSGHDSAEDAQIAVELVIAKLKSDSTNK